jgi:hypothetical protein
MHKKLMAIVAILGVCIFAGDAARGNLTWLGDPPHVGFPGWQTPSPYQRNIYLDFSVDPQGVASIPGADYEGYDDPVLQDSDFLVYWEAYEWFPSGNPAHPEWGTLGIDNTTGGGWAPGYMGIMVNNWDTPSQLKHVWVEIAVQSYDEAEDWLFLRLEAPGHIVEEGVWWNETLDVLWGAWTVVPNPVQEVFWLDMFVPPGGELYIDSIHIATECVPVPGAVLLCVLGLSVAGVTLRKSV